MPSLESGTLLVGRYLLQQRLGDGGHAGVWAAEDRQTGQRVALKFMHEPGCAADESWRVLTHEAAMAQRLDHPGVLRPGTPERDGATVFLPMEYAAGGDVRALRGAPWQQVLPVLLQVAQVLEHAHSRGVVHRDIKPGNVLFDEQGRVKVTDFGTATRTGSTLALADGSPFSASPQQLDGEAATTADDVHGLGALAYELLSRYPPYYPEFDAQRVQNEDPADLVPAHPAPAALVALVMAMLARASADRPDLRTVIDTFRQLLGEEQPAPPPASRIIEEAPTPDPNLTLPLRRRRVPAIAWLAAAALLAGIAFTLLPRLFPMPVSRAASAPAAAAADAAPAAARPAAPVVDTAQLAQVLAAGREALRAMQPEQARAAFLKAQQLQSDNADARAGLAAEQALEQRLAQYTTAMKAEAAGDLEQALQQYTAILGAQKDFTPARDGLERVRRAKTARELEAALAEGANAFAAGHIDAAERAYQRAAAIDADGPRVRDGLARIAELRRSQRNAADAATGSDLERQERWDDAVAHYQAVLVRDGTLLFAADGLARSTRRAQLDRELQDYLDRSERLTAPAVRAAAERALARGAATQQRGPRLDAQLQHLQQQLAQLAATVRVEISSDNNTSVSVAPVGELGIFVTRELQLPPGQYTVIGRRDGFRDVRMDLHLAPGQQHATLLVQCTERI